MLSAPTYVSPRSERIESLIEGHAVLVARDGKIFDEQLRKHRVGRADVELDATRPDVVALQEPKAPNSQLPKDQLSSLGYASLCVGQKAWATWRRRSTASFSRPSTCRTAGPTGAVGAQNRARNGIPAASSH
jgi:hypothetical protein